MIFPYTKWLYRVKALLEHRGTLPQFAGIEQQQNSVHIVRQDS